MRRLPSLGLTLAVLAALSAATLSSCFSPRQPGCAFSCARDRLCPAQYFCADDGFCHRSDGVGACTLMPADAGATDSPEGRAPDAVDGRAADAEGGPADGAPGDGAGS